MCLAPSAFASELNSHPRLTHTPDFLQSIIWRLDDTMPPTLSPRSRPRRTRFSPCVVVPVAPSTSFHNTTTITNLPATSTRLNDTDNKADPASTPLAQDPFLPSYVLLAKHASSFVLSQPTPSAASIPTKGHAKKVWNGRKVIWTRGSGKGEKGEGGLATPPLERVKQRQPLAELDLSKCAGRVPPPRCLIGLGEGGVGMGGMLSPPLTPLGASPSLVAGGEAGTAMELDGESESTRDRRRKRERRAREEREESEREGRVEVEVLWEGWWAKERGMRV